MYDSRLLLLSPQDNVLVLRGAIDGGEDIKVGDATVRVHERIGIGHKIARHAIRKGDKIVKYGAPIGSATMDIAVGDHVHLQNVQSDYTPTYALASSEEVPK